MGYARCPKCGFDGGEFEDECPRCGVYVSKFLAMQGRRASAGMPIPPPGPGQVPVPGGAAAADAAGAAVAPDRWSVKRIGIWAAIAVAYAGVGYVVAYDWFGPAFKYTPPPGWQRVEDETVERSVEGMCPRARAGKTFHAIYLPSGGMVPGQPPLAIGVVESEEVMAMDEAAAARLRALFEVVRSQPGLDGVMIGDPAVVAYGGRKAIEGRIDISMRGSSFSVLQVMFGADHSTFMVVMTGPTDDVRKNVDALHASLASFRILAPQGLRGAAWFKYGLRWTYVLALLVLVGAVYTTVRNRA